MAMVSAEAGYSHGKLIFDGLLAIVGVSELKYLMKTGNFSANALKLISKKAKNLVPSRKWADEIFTNSIGSRETAELLAQKTKYMGMKNANDVLKTNNPIYDLFDEAGNVVDVTTTSAKKLSTSQFAKKLERLASLKDKNNRILQIYVKAGQYTKAELGDLERKLNKYIELNLQDKKVNFSIDEVK